MTVEVECYAGYAGEETPIAFRDDGTRVLIASVLDRWRTPTARCFRVQAYSGRIYVLSQDLGTLAWRIESMGRPS
jgi:hypothetical protein